MLREIGNLGNQKSVFLGLEKRFQRVLRNGRSNDMGKGQADARKLVELARRGLELVEQGSVIEVNPDQSQAGSRRRYTEKANRLHRPNTRRAILPVRPHNMDRAYINRRAVRESRS